MIASPNQQRRFSDQTNNETAVFSHDIGGSIKRMIELLSGGKSLDEAKELIGHREGVDDEGKCLADFAELILTTTLLDEASIRVSKYDASERHFQSFKLNTEVVRLALTNALSDKTLSQKLDEMDFQTFGILITEIHQKQHSVMQKYREELNKK